MGNQIEEYENYIRNLYKQIEDVSSVFCRVEETASSIFGIISQLNVNRIRMVENSTTTIKEEVTNEVHSSLNKTDEFYSRMLKRRKDCLNVKLSLDKNTTREELEDISESIITNVEGMIDYRKAALRSVNKSIAMLLKYKMSIPDNLKLKFIVALNFCIYFYNIALTEYGHIRSFLIQVNTFAMSNKIFVKPIYPEELIKAFDFENSKITNENKIPRFDSDKMKNLIDKLDDDDVEVVHKLLSYEIE